MVSSRRLVHVKSSAKEKDYPAFSPDDIIFLFGNITHPEGLILNHSDPSECFVIFAQTAPISEIYGLNEEPSWVGAPCSCLLDNHVQGYTILLTNSYKTKLWRRGKNMSSSQLNLRRRRVLKAHSPTPPQKKDEPIATVLAEQFKQVESQDLHQILSAIQTEFRSM